MVMNGQQILKVKKKKKLKREVEKRMKNQRELLYHRICQNNESLIKILLGNKKYNKNEYGQTYIKE